MSEPSPHPDPVAALRDQFAAAGDGLLLQDRQRLAGRLRQLEHRRRARQPVDRLSEALARDLEQARIRWQARQGWQPVFEFPAPLPVSLHRDRIREALQRHQVIIVCGDTGSGKTTQLPKIALQAGRGRLGRIGVTQPRRLAAVSMARRVADELHVDLGRQVGYQVRFSNAFGDETAVKFMTDGILLAETRQDRRLWQYDTIVLDEAHERSLNIDFLLGYLKNLLPQRPDLKLIISSATIDPESFAQFFDNAPVLMVEGRSHPIEDLWFPSLGPDEEIVRHVARAVRWVDELDPEGDILVFLPGEREIRDAAELLRGWLETHGARRGGGHDSPPHPSASPPNDGRRHGRPLPRRGEAFRSPLPSGGEGQGEGAGGGGPSRNPQTEILPLFARLSLAEQQRVFSVGSRRRIVLATNVAETSLTIPGIRYVIDSGLVRLNRYLPRRQIQSLQVEQVSQASAQQRRGRCGRVAEGVCVHLYAEAVLLESPAFTDPEIRRSSLAGVILQMAALELPPIAEFPFLDPPSRSLVEQGYRTLFEIGALDAQRQLTPLGRQLAQFPLDPQIGRMILQARDEHVVSEVLVLAAVLTIQDPRERPLDNLAAADAAHAPWRDPRSDFFGFLRLWNAWQQAWRTLPTTNRVRRWCKANYLSYRRIIEWQNLVRELAELVREQGWKVRIPGPVHDDSFYDRVHRAVIAGIPLQIGRREETMDYRAARGPAFYIFPGSALFEKAPPWVVAFALVETAKLYARVVGEINPEWVEQVAPHLCRQTHVDIEWDAEQGFVYAREIVSCGELTLLADRRVHYGRVDPATAREVFLREGMVPGNLRSGHAWRRDHQRLLDEIRTLEHKIRRPHGLLNEPAIFVHFDRLIPADVCSTRALDDWLHRERRDIRVPRAVALAAISDPVHEADWPDALTFPGHAFPLRYRCAPGEADDGITLVCSESLLASLPPWGTDWLVAGALPEKVRLLIRTLPKELWTACQPLPHTVEAFLQEVTNRPVVPEANPPHPAPQTAAGPASPPEGRGICRRDPLSPPGGAESDETPRGHGRQRVRVRGRLVFTGAAQSLTKALAQYLTRRLRMPVTAEQFAPDRLPEHLVMKVAVTDAAGKTLRVTRGRPAEAGYTSRLPAKSDWLPREWDRHGWTDWEGPALPESVPLPSCAAAGRAGYPALVDEGQTVGVRLFLDAGEAQEQHAAGVVRLFRRCAAELVERFQKNLPVPQACQRALLALPGERGSALDDFVELLIEEVVRGGGPDAAYPRGPAVFRERVDAARSELFELASARADLLGRVMEQRAAALQAAGPVRSDAGAVPAVADIDRQLVFLFRPGFLGATDLLPHYPRYLRAVVIRLERLRLDPVKDRTKAGAVRPFQEQLDARWVKLQGRPPPSLLRFATLLQEYRVAQFAQELGTAEKVSPKRLQTAWEKVEAHG